MSKRTKVTVVSQLQALIAGTQKHTPNGSLTFGGATYTVKALVALLTKLIDAIAATEPAKASYRVALNAQDAAKTEVDPIALAYSQYLRALLGNAPETLGDYGLAPKKVPAPLSAVQLAARAAKAEATRIARGTKGPKQKAGIKGTVTAPTAGAATPAKPA
jgi:hypothetical protein